MAINSILSQSNYPIQTIINNDTVVILTKQQADDINVIFESQKAKIKSLREERDSLLSLSSELKKETIIVDSVYEIITKENVIIKNSLLVQSIDNALLLYDPETKSPYMVDLHYYSFQWTVEGNLIFMPVPLKQRKEWDEMLKDPNSIINVGKTWVETIKKEENRPPIKQLYELN
jgi:hypothetical protein